MVLNGYNYHEKSSKKVDLNTLFYKQKLSSKRYVSVNRRKAERTGNSKTLFGKDIDETTRERPSCQSRHFCLPTAS